MVRSMYSGVSGMRAHQTRMDVIGNNIANVNTYGFKSSRATFRDMYYQNIRGAAAGTANRGGLNPSAIGYGSSISSVDMLMTQSTMSPTGNPLDVAICGEGFLQVQDSDGNVFYTKAGMLDIDNNGNLIDSNGYFVLGTSGNPLGKAPGSNKIAFTVDPVDPNAGAIETSVNGVKFTIEASNSNKDSNVNFVFESGNDLPLGKKAEAIIDGSTVTIRVNPAEQFPSLQTFQAAVNNAITEFNGGVEHPAGEFKFSVSPDPFAAAAAAGKPLTGEEIVGNNFGYNKGSVTLPQAGGIYGGFKPKANSAGTDFSAVGKLTYKMTHTAGTAGPPATEGFFVMTATGVNAAGTAVTYTSQQVKESQMGKTPVMLKNAGSDADSISMSCPSLDSIIDIANGANAANADRKALLAAGLQFGDYETATPANLEGTAVASSKSRDVGLGKNFKLDGGTAGGPQTLKDLTGISIGADGSIIASHAVHGRIPVGRIDLAIFDNAAGLQQSGNSYFAASANSGKASLTTPGENGAGALKNSALETSNVDLSQEFSDMITTQRGFQANSRLITVSDTMLEELINLKR